MARTIPILCLANSIKNQARCLAGVRLDTGGWIRPVSDRNGSALVKERYSTKSGHVPEPPDSIRVGLERPSPLCNQPENWVISNTDWELITEEIDTRQKLALNTGIQRSGPLFTNSEDKVKKSELSDSPVDNSLAIIKPEVLEFKLRRGSPRAEFRFDGNTYDLSITDPQWRKRADQGMELPSTSDMPDDREVLFTLSLGEEYKGACYKLIAAIFSVDSSHMLEF